MGEVYCARDTKLGRDIGLPHWPAIRRRQYDVARDGRLLIDTVLDAAVSPITLIQNWKPPAK